MKELKAYGIDLMTGVNFERLTTKEFTDTVKALPGFLGFAPHTEQKRCRDAQAEKTD